MQRQVAFIGHIKKKRDNIIWHLYKPIVSMDKEKHFLKAEFSA